MKNLLRFGLIVLFTSLSPLLAASGKNYCGELYHRWTYGPFDYRDRFNLREELDMVEGAHFTPEIENLIRGRSGTLGGELNYTLHSWPNHHRALISLAKLSLREKSARLSGMRYPVECYFDRAIRFRPDDGEVRTIYGGYLSKVGRPNQAIEQLEIAVGLQPESAIAHYNLGLLYFDKKEYNKSRKHAKAAYALNFPLPGLKNKLIRAGKWAD